MGCSRRQFIAAAGILSCGCCLQAAGKPSASLAEKDALPVRIPHASLRLKSPNSALFGITADGIIEISYADVLKVHGYCGGGAAYAFRMAQEAFKTLYEDRLPVRQAIQVKTSHHCCQADALAYITGARNNYGAFVSQGDFMLLPEDEKKTVFIDKPTGKTVTLHMHFNPHHTFEPLFKKAMKDSGFAPEVHKMLNEKIAEYLTAPVHTLFDISLEKS